jgi:hypothetical protein
MNLHANLFGSAHARGAALADLGLLGLLVADALVQNLGVFVLVKRSVRGSVYLQCDCVTYGSILAGLRAAALEGDPVALVLETLRSDETLDARSLGVRLGALLLGLDLATDDEFADLESTAGQLVCVVSGSTVAPEGAGWRRGVEGSGHEYSHRLPC